MKKEILMLVSMILISGGIGFFVGTIMALNCKMIELNTAIIQGIMEIVVTVIGFFGLKIGDFVNGDIERGN